MNDNMLLIAGPCSMESEKICFEVANTMCPIAERFGLNYYYKTSFDKANRTSIDSWRGLGIEEGLRILEHVKQHFGCKIVTDIHEPWQAAMAAEVVDMLQIPAYLSRQTDLLISAAQTGLPVNVKKAQFMAPSDMINVVNKLEESGCDSIYLCERGTCFGYNDLTVDMRSIPLMKMTGRPVVFDATHSVQKPGSGGNQSGGDRTMVRTLALAAAAAGADGFFFECHPTPEEALCDGANMMPLEQMESIIKELLVVRRVLNYCTA